MSTTATHQLYLEQYGDPAQPTILFIHGLIGSTRYWHPLLPSLKSYHVVLIDLLGFGKSPKPKRIAYDSRDHLDAIQTTLQRHHISDIRLVVGLSTGALLAEALVEQFPDMFESALLLSPTVFPDGKSFNRFQKRAGLTTRFFGYGPQAWLICNVLVCRWPLIGEPFVRLLARNLSLPQAVADDTIKHTYNSYRKTRIGVLEDQSYLYPERLKRPVIVVVGPSDKRLDHDYLAAFFARSPRTEVIVRPGIGHHPSYTHRELILKLINSLMHSAGTKLYDEAVYKKEIV